MKDFSLILSDHIPEETKIDVYELCKHNKSLFQPFYEQIERDGNLFGNLAGAIRVIQDTANMQRRPQTKFREIKGHNLKCKLYEAKSGVIRIYLFHEENKGRVIVVGGLKDNQDKDLKSVKRIIKDYQDEKER